MSLKMSFFPILFFYNCSCTQFSPFSLVRKAIVCKRNKSIVHYRLRALEEQSTSGSCSVNLIMRCMVYRLASKNKRAEEALMISSVYGRK